MHLKHQPEMMAMIENEILLGDKIDYKNERNCKNRSFHGSFTF